VRGVEMSIRDELKELIDKYYDAILRADFAEKEMDMQESVEALYEEEHIRKQVYAKIDEVVDINEPKWIPIEKQEPSDQDWYLVFFPANNEYGNTDYIDVCFWNGVGFEGGAFGYQQDGIEYTHWMPLPEMPKR